MSEPVRWGIISTAKIGMTKVTPAIQKAANCKVVAIASRDHARAEAAASALGIPRAHGSYEALFADPEVEAVYIPLPNHLHVDMTLAAARAGKHVLCEKPVGLDASDAMRLRDLPEGTVFEEAFMVRYHPQWLRAREIAASGELGEIRAVRSIFAYHNVDPQDVRNQADIGGGGILDIGCYPITGARFVFGAEPQRVVALVDRDPGFGTDRTASVVADFGGGRQLTFLCSTQMVPHQSLEILGTKGRVEIVVPYNAPQGAPTALLVDEGLSPDGHLARREILPACDQYTLQAEAFARAVRGEARSGYGIEDAISSMRVLDAVFESERTGGWATVASA